MTRVTESTFADFGISVPYGRSGEVRTACPECGPRRKSGHQNEKDLAVNVDEGVWLCHHCGWSGALAGSDPDAYGTMPTRKQKSYRPPKPIVEVPIREGAKDPLDSFAQSRGLPVQALRDASITAAMAWCPQCEREMACLAIPYVRGGEVVHVKYRHKVAGGGKHIWSSKDTMRPLYGVDTLIGKTKAIVVEGELDQVAMTVALGESASEWGIISVPDGAPDPKARSYESKFNFLTLDQDLLDGLTVVIIATDADPPGDHLADELARRLKPGRCKRVRWQGGKDANDVLKEHGPRAVLAALEEADPYPVSGIFTVNDLWPRVEALYARGRDEGHRIGWDGFDALARAKPGVFAVVTGKPFDGKSEFVDNWMSMLAAIYDWPIGICSPENQPLEDYLARIIQRFSGRPFHGQGNDRITLAELREQREWLNDHFVMMLPEHPTMESILELAEVEVYRRGIKALVIDPWTELEHSRPNNMSETEYTGRELTALKDFGRRHKLFTVLVAHPTKLYERQNKKDGSWYWPVANLYNISGSSNFANKADLGISVWRDLDPASDTYDHTYVHILKVRFRDTGRKGVAHLTYDPKTLMFTDAAGMTKISLEQMPAPWELDS